MQNNEAFGVAYFFCKALYINKDIMEEKIPGICNPGVKYSQKTPPSLRRKDARNTVKAEVIVVNTTS